MFGMGMILILQSFKTISRNSGDFRIPCILQHSTSQINRLGWYISKPMFFHLECKPVSLVRHVSEQLVVTRETPARFTRSLTHPLFNSVSGVSLLPIFALLKLLANHDSACGLNLPLLYTAFKRHLQPQIHVILFSLSYS